MKAINGNAKKRPDRISRQRNALLAKIHIAVKDLGILEDDYRDILEREFFVKSAAALSIDELQRLVRRWQDCGWKPTVKRGKGKSEAGKRGKGQAQVEALRERAEGLAGELEDGDKRLRGLVKKICGVENLEWCRDVKRLKRLLAALETIRANEMKSATKGRKR